VNPNYVTKFALWYPTSIFKKISGVEFVVRKNSHAAHGIDWFGFIVAFRTAAPERPNSALKV